MFFQPDRILAVREMILAKDEAGRRAALAKILPMQREDFIGIFREMDGLPVTIRLLDPPLHEFLPHARADIEEVAREMGENPDVVAGKVAELTEANPMLGHRGCRLAITWPEIYETQAQAIAEAAVAAHADFFSFGTNDLTQTTLGISRDDGGKFMKAYLETDLLAADPFAVLDQEGVGALVRMAVDKGRATKPGLKLGICGEHGGDPASVAFCHRVGLDYVSCSPFRVPIARVAAARAALTETGNP
jgi:pyruvate,orthophosphate dikinase